MSDEAGIQGETVLYGRLISLDGLIAQLARLDGQIMACEIAEDTALVEQLRNRVNTEIGVRGVARWRLSDMALVGFCIEQLLSYRELPLADALEQSHQVMGHYMELLNNVEAD